jgi:hypothetical protein
MTERGRDCSDGDSSPVGDRLGMTDKRDRWWGMDSSPGDGLGMTERGRDCSAGDSSSVGDRLGMTEKMDGCWDMDSSPGDGLGMTDKRDRWWGMDSSPGDGLGMTDMGGEKSKKNWEKGEGGAIIYQDILIYENAVTDPQGPG